MFPLSVPYRNIAIAVAAVLLILAIYAKGRLDEKKIFDAYKLQEQVIVQSTEKVQSQITKESSNVYKAKAVAVSNYYNGLYNNGSNQVSSASFRTDATPTYSVLVGQCAQTTLQLVSLQSWIKEQSDATQEISK